MCRSGGAGVPSRHERRQPACVTLVARDFTAMEPNTKGGTDITYIRTAEHWLYLCIVLGL